MRNLTADKPNLFVDSGLGGLTTLLQAQALLPEEKFIYCADFKNSPYGNKTLKQIQNIVLHNLKHLDAEYSPKSVVFACNTATATTIQEVRRHFPHTVVVGAEPAIKPALRSGKKKILVLCTKVTLKESSMVQLFKIHKKENLDFCVLPELATLIDNFYSVNPQLIHKYLTEKLSRYRGRYDGVVLGCTHYIIVGQDIKNILGAEELFNGNFGIANRLKHCLDMLGLRKEPQCNDERVSGERANTENAESSLNRNVQLISTDADRQDLLLQNYQYLSERRKELCVV